MRLLNFLTDSSCCSRTKYQLRSIEDNLLMEGEYGYKFCSGFGNIYLNDQNGSEIAELLHCSGQFSKVLFTD